MYDRIPAPRRTPIVRRPPSPARLAAMRAHFWRATTNPTDIDDPRADLDYPYDLGRAIGKLTEAERRALISSGTGAATEPMSCSQ